MPIRCRTGCRHPIPKNQKIKKPRKNRLGRVAKVADAQDLKSWVPKGACGFESRLGYCTKFTISQRVACLGKSETIGERCCDKVFDFLQHRFRLLLRHV